jgi:hypothetical protein
MVAAARVLLPGGVHSPSVHTGVRLRRRLRPTWDAIAPLVPAVVLVAVAAAQVRAVMRERLSPWKGGAFGMFSTVESPASRVVRATIVSDRGEYVVRAPPELSMLERAVRTSPSDARAAELAAALARTAWIPDRALTPAERYRELLGQPAGGTAAPERSRIATEEFVRAATRHEGAAGAIRVHRARVEVWQLRFDHADASLSSRRITAATRGPRR